MGKKSKHRARKKRKVTRISKKRVFRRLPKKKKRKASLRFRTQKPSRAAITYRQRSTVLSLDASKGSPLEILAGSQVIPYLIKIRAKMGYPRYTVEFGKAILLFKMPSGVMKHREANYSGESAKVVNLGLAKEIDALIKEGTSQTKTAENVYLSTVSIKRIYVKK